jgi:hypothetical protein
MKEAQAAMGQAKAFHADNLAPADFQQAQKSWDHAQAAEKEGKTAAAKVLYTNAKIYSGKAADIAKAKKEDMSRELSSMQGVINNNLDQVRSDVASKNLSPKQHDQVEAITSEVEKDNATISKLVIQEDLRKAIETAKNVQTKIYHAQLILAGQKVR